MSVSSKNDEVLILSGEILKNIELSEISLSGVVTKSLRLARLMGDSSGMNWLKLELSGYTSTPSGIPPEEFIIGSRSKRHYIQNDKKGIPQTFMVYDSVGKIEADLESAKAQLQVAVDPNSSVSSSNPQQHVYAPIGNQSERSGLRTIIANSAKNLEKIKVSIYEYILNIYYELKFADISESVFEKNRRRVDSLLIKVCPKGTQELVSAYQNLTSNNAADWSNTTNSCRRLLKDLADVIYPAGSKKVSDDGHKLSDSDYKNRLVEYVKNNSSSERFNEIVGSQLQYLSDRLDAVNNAGSKGVHSDITKEEAERVVIYTYLLVGDILTVVPNGQIGIQKMVQDADEEISPEGLESVTSNVNTVDTGKK